MLSKLRTLGRAFGALGSLYTAVACQLTLDLDKYSFAALPAEAGVAPEDGGQAGGAAGSSSAPPDATVPPDADGGGGDCGLCNPANAEGACESGACAIADCRAGYRDDNDLPGDGCEAPDVSTEGLLLWLMADRGVTADAQGLVSTWQDQSANEWQALAPSAAASPHRITIPEDRSILEFDGDDELVLPALPPFSSLSFFAVVEAREGPECPSLLHVSNRVNLDTENEIEIGRHVGALYYEVGPEPLSGPNNGFLAGVLQIASITHAPSDTTVSLYLGGALVARGAVPLPAPVQRTANYIGNNHWERVQDGFCNPFLGRMGEMLLYTRAMSDAERAVIEAYLAAKWGLSVAE